MDLLLLDDDLLRLLEGGKMLYSEMLGSEYGSELEDEEELEEDLEEEYDEERLREEEEEREEREEPPLSRVRLLLGALSWFCSSSSLMVIGVGSRRREEPPLVAVVFAVVALATPCGRSRQTTKPL